MVLFRLIRDSGTGGECPNDRGQEEVLCFKKKQLCIPASLEKIRKNYFIIVQQKNTGFDRERHLFMLQVLELLAFT